MASRLRNDISVRGITYQRLQEHCRAAGITLNGFVEAILTEEMDARGVPLVEALPKEEAERISTTPPPKEGLGGVHEF